jgi:hypothetical protein
MRQLLPRELLPRLPLLRALRHTPVTPFRCFVGLIPIPEALRTHLVTTLPDTLRVP